MLFQFFKDNISATGVLNIKGFHFVMESRTPNIYKDLLSAFTAGKPNILHMIKDNPTLKKSNRNDAIGDYPVRKGEGLERQEYPYATTYEGGKGAYVTYVPEGEQRIEGGQLSVLSRILNDKDAFMVLPVPKGREPDDIKELALQRYREPVPVPAMPNIGRPVIPYNMWPVVAGAAVVGAAWFIIQRIPAIP